MIRITFFGDFTLSHGEITLSCNGAGAQKLYRALAYLIKERSRRIDREDFSRFLHDNKPYRKGSDDSLVKVTLHRLRELLSDLVEGETIIARDGGIWLSPTLTFDTDADRFTALFEAYENSDRTERKLFLYKELANLYRGRYLASFFGEEFTMPEAERYHRRFIALSEDALARMIDRGEYADVIKIVQKAAMIDPYCEVFHYYRILALSLSGDKALAASIHHSITHLFLREFHVAPSSRFRALSAGLVKDKSLDVTTCDEALTALQTIASQNESEYFASLAEIMPTLALLDRYHLLLATGDAKAILPHLKALFPRRARLARLSDRALLLVSTEKDTAFEASLAALRDLIAHGKLTARLDYKKYRADN